MIGSVSSTPAQGAAPQDERTKLEAVAQQFEAVFLRQLIGSMRSASLGEDILGSSASDQFRDMSDARTADAMAGKGALGIADMLIKQLEKTLPAKADPGAAVASAAADVQGASLAADARSVK